MEGQLLLSSDVKLNCKPFWMQGTYISLLSESSDINTNDLGYDYKNYGLLLCKVMLQYFHSSHFLQIIFPEQSAWSHNQN